MENLLQKNTDAPIRNTLLYEYCSEEWHPIIDLNQIILNKKKGELIISAGEQVKGIYIILNGKVKVVSPSFNNEEYIHRLAGDGKILGHRGFSTPYYPISAIALTDLTISFFPNYIF